MKEKYIGKSASLAGEGKNKDNAPKVKLDININAPEEISAEEYNAGIENIRPEVKRAHLLGNNVMVRLFRYTDSMLEASFAKVPTESGTQMTAKKEIVYQDYGKVVAVGKDCKLGLKTGMTVRIASLDPMQKARLTVFFDGDFDNYFLLNENLIIWHE